MNFDSDVYFCYTLYMKYLKLATFAIFLATVLDLLLNIPSHPECGTAGIDFMPCGYLDRLTWNLNNGSWMFVLIVAIAFTGFGYLVVKSRQRLLK